MTRRSLAPWQLRAWLAVAVVALLATWCLFIVGSVPPQTPQTPQTPEEWPAWVIEGGIVVLGVLQVSGPDGRPWFVVRWKWRDMSIESAHTGPWAEREAQVLRAVLTQRMVAR